ncbi:Transcriptional regulator, TetR family [[Actinomadura] parvosata subsp. kistnae]|uniref:TetR family transcriptional regulator n=2 Tax=Nonomuraea TaxID=83681 RepID=A0A1V0AEW8_9ACTN|nr:MULTISPECIES: TetR/AcrR family transcriptional regulator [unclassified Nonomuraea]AQZ68774.1 TetR family transcriptional regulator [Nonomuraea sp. ATCC 55076]NJP89776.1 TetR/AcrR family transcriptional regulator [Nonomuraea sp. FMUSA5-5]SPL92717.1 Transcriptional regulator, TetR family [Actinomadura parvosata subsp. kistnae]
MSPDVENAVAQPRTSERGAATRSSLLAAAREVFVSKGFAEAGVTDVVSRADASVGSLYHHFSGKADLYLTLWEEFQARQTQRTKQAVRAARAEGESDPMRVFVGAARAYLDGCLEERETAALFLRGDGPPGFEVVMRDRLRKWAQRNAALFENEPALVVVVTGALAAAVSEVVRSGDRGLAEEVLAIIGQIRPATSATTPSNG